MTATAADIGYNASFGIGDTADPIVYTIVGEVTNITPPGRTRGTIDATRLKSPDEYLEYIAGMAETGEATITMNFVPSATDLLVTAFEAKSGSFQVLFPNGIKLTFSGIVTAYEFGELSIDKMTSTFTVKGSGKAVLAAAD
jgi:hypothetical protein